MSNEFTPEMLEECVIKIQKQPEPRKYTCSICGKKVVTPFPCISRKTMDAVCEDCMAYERRLVHNCLLRGKRKDFLAYKRYMRKR